MPRIEKWRVIGSRQRFRTEPYELWDRDNAFKVNWMFGEPITLRIDVDLINWRILMKYFVNFHNKVYAPLHFFFFFEILTKEGNSWHVLYIISNIYILKKKIHLCFITFPSFGILYEFCGGHNNHQKLEKRKRNLLLMSMFFYSTRVLS